MELVGKLFSWFIENLQKNFSLKSFIVYYADKTCFHGLGSCYVVLIKDKHYLVASNPITKSTLLIHISIALQNEYTVSMYVTGAHNKNLCIRICIYTLCS